MEVTHAPGAGDTRKAPAEKQSSILRRPIMTKRTPSRMGIGQGKWEPREQASGAWEGHEIEAESNRHNRPMCSQGALFFPYDPVQEAARGKHGAERCLLYVVLCVWQVP